MCWKCGNDIEDASFIARSAECPFCHADLHSCRNCTFYSPGSHYDCHETVEEPVRDKERANFCGSFKPKLHFPPVAKKADARKKLEALFKL